MTDAKRKTVTGEALARIATLEEYVRSDIEKDQGEAIALVLCEIARQLARIACLYAVETGAEGGPG